MFSEIPDTCFTLINTTQIESILCIIFIDQSIPIED